MASALWGKKRLRTLKPIFNSTPVFGAWSARLDSTYFFTDLAPSHWTWEGYPVLFPPEYINSLPSSPSPWLLHWPGLPSFLYPNLSQETFYHIGPGGTFALGSVEDVRCRLQQRKCRKRRVGKRVTATLPLSLKNRKIIHLLKVLMGYLQVFGMFHYLTCLLSALSKTVRN